LQIPSNLANAASKEYRKSCANKKIYPEGVPPITVMNSLGSFTDKRDADNGKLKTREEQLMENQRDMAARKHPGQRSLPFEITRSQR
jgi:hypothetical protein